MCSSAFNSVAGRLQALSAPLLPFAVMEASTDFFLSYRSLLAAAPKAHLSF